MKIQVVKTIEKINSRTGEAEQVIIALLETPERTLRLEINASRILTAYGRAIIRGIPTVGDSFIKVT